jgi:hypothetical protein
MRMRSRSRARSRVGGIIREGWGKSPLGASATPRPDGHPSPAGIFHIAPTQSPLSRGVARRVGVCCPDLTEQCQPRRLAGLTGPTRWLALGRSFCGRSISVLYVLPKHERRVRLPPPAPSFALALRKNFESTSHFSFRSEKKSDTQKPWRRDKSRGIEDKL